MVAVRGLALIPKALHSLLLLAISACVIGSALGARKLQRETLINEGSANLDDAFGGQLGPQLDAIEDVLSAATHLDDADALHRLLFATVAYPPPPPPKMPPGLAVTVEDYTAKFVNASLTANLTAGLDDQFNLQAFIRRFKAITSRVLKVATTDVLVKNVYRGGQRLTRRLALERPVRSWSAFELASLLPPDTNMRQLVHVRSYSADFFTLDALRARDEDLPRRLAEDEDTTYYGSSAVPDEDPATTTSSSPTSFEPARRVLSLEDGNIDMTDDDVILVDFAIQRIVEVALPPSLPPSPPLSPGQVAPPDAPMSPPPRPSRPPAIPPFKLDKLAKVLGADSVAVAPVAPPQSPSPPQAPPSPPQSPPNLNPSPPSPPSLPPSPPPTPSPPPKHTRKPPSPPPAEDLTVPFGNISADGSTKTDRASSPVVWYDNPALAALRKPRSNLNLIYDWASSTYPHQCKITPGVCRRCPRSWAAKPTAASVYLFFREPVQLDQIRITLIQKPGVQMVQLLPWPAVPIPELPDLKPRNGFLGEPVWNVTSDATRCGTDLVINLASERSGTQLPVPESGSQGQLPRTLKGTMVGGVVVTVLDILLAGSRPTTEILSVRFSGRVLYPRDPARYT